MALSQGVELHQHRVSGPVDVYRLASKLSFDRSAASRLDLVEKDDRWRGGGGLRDGLREKVRHRALSLAMAELVNECGSDLQELEPATLERLPAARSPVLGRGSLAGARRPDEQDDAVEGITSGRSCRAGGS